MTLEKNILSHGVQPRDVGQKSFGNTLLLIGYRDEG